MNYFESSLQTNGNAGSNEYHWHKRFAHQNRYNSAGKFDYFGIQSNRLESLYNIILDEIFRPVTSKKP